MFSIQEMLRMIQFYNSTGYQCSDTSEDGYAPGYVDENGGGTCDTHAADFAPADFRLELTELLRQIQIFNGGGYNFCPDAGTEDGYCVGRLTR
jgi:hypothetical protein